MPSQSDIGAHLDLSQKGVSELLAGLGIDAKTASLDQVRVAYIRKLRAEAAGHKSEDGLDLVRERVLTERIDRELKELQVAEKRGALVNVEQLEAELGNMVAAFRTELIARDDKLKAELDALYGIDLDVNLLNEHTIAALEQLARYDASGSGDDSTAGAAAAAAGEANDD